MHLLASKLSDLFSAGLLNSSRGKRKELRWLLNAVLSLYIYIYTAHSFQLPMPEREPGRIIGSCQQDRAAVTNCIDDEQPRVSQPPLISPDAFLSFFFLPSVIFSSFFSGRKKQEPWFDSSFWMCARVRPAFLVIIYIPTLRLIDYLLITQLSSLLMRCDRIADTLYSIIYKSSYKNIVVESGCAALNMFSNVESLQRRGKIVSSYWKGSFQIWLSTKL